MGRNTSRRVANINWGGGRRQVTKSYDMYWGGGGGGGGRQVTKSYKHILHGEKYVTQSCKHKLGGTTTTSHKELRHVLGGGGEGQVTKSYKHILHGEKYVTQSCKHKLGGGRRRQVTKSYDMYWRGGGGGGTSHKELQTYTAWGEIRHAEMQTYTGEDMQVCWPSYNFSTYTHVQTKVSPWRCYLGNC